MAVGFDSDDTIFYHNAPFKEWLGKEKGLLIKGFEDYRLWKAWGGTKEEAVAYIEEFYKSELGDLRLTLPGIEDIIAFYKQRGEDLYVISSRSFSQDKVLAAYDDLFPGTFKDIVFGGHFLIGGKKTKADIAADLGIHTFFEDAYHHAEDLSRKDITTYLTDTSWNQHRGEDAPNIIREDDWIVTLPHLRETHKYA